MSATTTKQKNWWVRSGMVVGIVTIVRMVGPDISEYLNPAHLAPVRAAVADVDARLESEGEKVATRLSELEAEEDCINDEGLTDWDCWAKGRRPVAHQVARGQDERDLQIGIATRTIPRNAVMIPWGRAVWTPIGPVETPTWILVGKRNTNGTEDLDPQGIYPDGKPTKYEYNKTVAEKAGMAWIPYQAPLIRFRGGPPQQLVTRSLLCENPGKIDIFFNEFVEQAGGPSARAFHYHGFEGNAYAVWFLKDGAQQACDQLKQPQPPAGTVLVGGQSTN